MKFTRAIFEFGLWTVTSDPEARKWLVERPAIGTSPRISDEYSPSGDNGFKIGVSQARNAIREVQKRQLQEA